MYLGQQGNQGVAGLVDLQTATGGTDVGMDEFRHWSAVVSAVCGARKSEKAGWVGARDRVRKEGQ